MCVTCDTASSVRGDGTTRKGLEKTEQLVWTPSIILGYARRTVRKRMIYGIASDKVSFNCVETRACGAEINELYLCAGCGEDD